MTKEIKSKYNGEEIPCTVRDSEFSLTTGVTRGLNLYSRSLISTALIVSFVLTVSLYFSPPSVNAQFDKNQIRRLDSKKGKLQHLAKYIGTYLVEEVLEDPLVAGKLSQILGDGVPTLKANLQVRGEVDMRGGFLVIVGNKPHRAQTDAAIVMVRIADGSVRIGLLANGFMTIYAPEPVQGYLHSVLLEWIHSPAIGELIKTLPTEKFRWIRTE